MGIFKVDSGQNGLLSSNLHGLNAPASTSLGRMSPYLLKGDHSKRGQTLTEKQSTALWAHLLGVEERLEE